MIRKQITSTNLRSIGYDPDSSVLEIEFLNGTIYQYAAVPLQVYNSLMAANSHGTYFNANIRKANYRYTQVR